MNEEPLALTANTLQTHAADRSESPARRHEFVALMFALAVGELGIKASDLVKSGSFWTFYPAYAHLLLAATVIAASWVGWSTARRRGGLRDVDHPFQSQFIILLLDVLIVVQYFVLIRGIDLEENSPNAPTHFHLNAGSASETWGILCIFIVYFLWDMVWPQKPCASLLCAALAVLTVWKLGDLHKSMAVTLCDLSLLGLVLLFRALHLEFPPTEPTPAEESQSKTGRLAVIVCLFIWLVAGIAAYALKDHGA